MKKDYFKGLKKSNGEMSHVQGTLQVERKGMVTELMTETTPFGSCRVLKHTVRIFCHWI